MKHNTDDIMDDRHSKRRQTTDDTSPQRPRIATESPAIKTLQKLLPECEQKSSEIRARNAYYEKRFLKWNTTRRLDTSRREEVSIADEKPREIDMEKIEKINLPFDIQLNILQELMSLKPTNLLWDSRGGPSESKYEAILSYIQPGNHGNLKPGWTMSSSNRNYARRYYINKIFSLTSSCERFNKPSMEFFFGQITWRFASPEHVREVLGLTHCFSNIHHGPGTVLGCCIPAPGPKFPEVARIRNVSLKAKDRGVGWPYLANILEALYLDTSAPGKETPFPKLTRLLLILNHANVRCMNDTKRIRYLVTRCYQIVQKHPRLTIVFTGTSLNFAHSSFSAEEYVCARSVDWVKEQPARKFGFGYSEEEVKEFADGTSGLLSGLKHIEFPDIADGGFLTRGAHAHQWQMEVARQWRNIWAQGLEKMAGAGGYAAVRLIDTSRRAF